jgi:hypothetical protein
VSSSSSRCLLLSHTVLHPQLLNVFLVLLLTRTYKGEAQGGRGGVIGKIVSSHLVPSEGSELARSAD